jgi:mRNA-degrading endonuclease RelE of RelBE toxin-antitoxin system
MQQRQLLSYRLEIRREVYRQVAALPGHVRQRIRRLINNLPGNPRPSDAGPLRIDPDSWRYRIDRWRVVRRIRGGAMPVIVVKVGRKHGPEFYVDLPSAE